MQSPRKKQKACQTWGTSLLSFSLKPSVHLHLWSFYFTRFSETLQRPQPCNFDSSRNRCRMSFMICSLCLNRTSWIVPSPFKTMLARLWMNMTQWVVLQLQCKGGCVSSNPCTQKLFYLSVFKEGPMVIGIAPQEASNRLRAFQVTALIHFTASYRHSKLLV